MSQNSDTTNQQSTGSNVLAEVADALKASPTEVRTRLVKALTERELAKRVDLLDKALTKRAQLQTELNSIRMPTKKVFKLVDGKMVEAQVELTYSPEEAKKYNEDLKQHNKKVKEATEKLAKFDKTLEAAFGGEGADKLTDAFAKLAKLVSGGSVESDDSEKSEE